MCKTWDIMTVVHGDDFMSTGPKGSLKTFDKKLKETFMVKSEMLGPEGREDCVQQARF